MTTRRISGNNGLPELSYDHGCPAFEWPSSLAQNLNSKLNPSTIQNFYSLFVACPAMPQLVKDLLGSTPVNTQVEIERVEGHAHEWFLVEKKNTQSESIVKKFGPYEKLVLTAPAPQSNKILTGQTCNWIDELHKITYTPSWSIMFSVKGARHVSPSLKDSLFDTLILQNSKPSRNVPENIHSWVAQASPQWSKEHLEDQPEDVMRLLLPRALEIINSKTEDCLHSVAHRWRYSQNSNSLSCNFLADDTQGLYFVSDGCLGQGVAGAVAGGLALGEHLTSR